MKTKKCILGILFSFALVLGMALAGGSPACAADAGDVEAGSPISTRHVRTAASGKVEMKVMAALSKLIFSSSIFTMRSSLFI